MNRVIIRDLLLLVLNVLVLCIALMISKQTSQDSGQAPSAGQLAVVATWPEGDKDVDVWLDAPGEPAPVGFSNPNGKVWNLLRDDLGTTNDYLPTNFENAFTRGVPAGLYTINIKCYRCVSFPVPVTVELSEQSDGYTHSMEKLFTTTLLLIVDKQERTVFQFTVGSDGRIRRESLNRSFRPLSRGDKAAGPPQEP